MTVQAADASKDMGVSFAQPEPGILHLDEESLWVDRVLSGTMKMRPFLPSQPCQHHWPNALVSVFRIHRIRVTWFYYKRWWCALFLSH